MAVLIEAISVVIRAEALVSTFFGGWEGFKHIVPNQALCADNELVRVGFMDPADVELFVTKLVKEGLTFTNDDADIDVDIVVVDQLRGPLWKCPWVEFGHVNLNQNPTHKVATCRLVGSNVTDVVTPPGWTFEDSMSRSFGFVPSEHAAKGPTYLRHENGLDVYLDPITGKEMYVGRTGGSA